MILSQLVVPKKHDAFDEKSTRSDANQIKLGYVIYECAWSTGGFPCIWLVNQCKVRSFLKLLSIIDFHPVHLAILLDFCLFAVKPTMQQLLITGLANSQNLLAYPQSNMAAVLL